MIDHFTARHIPPSRHTHCQYCLSPNTGAFPAHSCVRCVVISLFVHTHVYSCARVTTPSPNYPRIGNSRTPNKHTTIRRRGPCLKFNNKHKQCLTLLARRAGGLFLAANVVTAVEFTSSTPKFVWTQKLKHSAHTGWPVYPGAGLVQLPSSSKQQSRNIQRPG